MKNRKQAIMPKKQVMPYGAMNIMQRTDMVNGLAKDVIAKLGKETITKQREQELIQKGLDEGVNNAFCAMLRVIWHNIGKLNKKETRMVNFEKLFIEALENVSVPDENQLLAEAVYTEQTGHPISREVIKG